MRLTAPIWLLLAIPLAVSFTLWPPAARLLRVVRSLSVLFVLLAMSGLAARLPDRAGTIVVVADRSRSMPSGAEALMKESVDLLSRNMGSRNRLGVVSFAEEAVVEQPPQAGEFAGFASDSGMDGSNLSAALDKALSLIPEQAAGRVLVLSDGKWTGRELNDAAARAAARQISIDYRQILRDGAGDLAIVSIEAPRRVTPGESYMLTAWVSSPSAQQTHFRLTRGGRLIAEGDKEVPQGRSRLTFRDTAPGAGTLEYRFSIKPKQQDPVPENNEARLLVGVEGTRPLLTVTNTPESGLVGLLRKGGMAVDGALPEAVRFDLESLSSFSSILVENVAAHRIANAGMETIAAWVKETGSGLMMTGGRDAYGSGGYFRSPLEEIMPVSMELRKEHRKLALAMVVALDRSGSMSASVAGGRTKMDLANVASVQVLDLLSAMDEFGVIAVDSQAHLIVDLAPVADIPYARDEVLGIQSMGGGIFIYEALAASADLLLKAGSETRHIILFADAADSEEPGEYRELLEKCREAGITVSVIGLGTRSDSDAALLEDIAARGRGRCFFTQSPEELPRLFAQDTFVVARSTFLSEITRIQPTAGLVALAGERYGNPPAILGYNLSYLRPGAQMAMVTFDEYSAPALAYWHAGAGRVLCYTGEANGKHTGPMARWNDIGAFFTTLARWTAGESDPLPGNMMLSQDVQKGIVKVRLHLDPDRAQESFSGTPKVRVLKGIAGRKPDAYQATMAWVSADELEAQVALRGSETLLATVEIDGLARQTLPPVCLPYSPEFAPASPRAGLLALSSLARTTGGVERINLGGMWNDLPPRPRWIDAAPWLLLAAVVLLLLETLERNTALLTAGRGAKARRPEIPAKQKQQAPPPRGDGGGEMLDALRKARRRAKDRTGRQPG